MGPEYFGNGPAHYLGGLPAICALGRLVPVVDDKILVRPHHRILDLREQIGLRLEGLLGQLLSGEVDARDPDADDASGRVPHGLHVEIEEYPSLRAGDPDPLVHVGPRLHDPLLETF